MYLSIVNFSGHEIKIVVVVVVVVIYWTTLRINIEQTLELIILQDSTWN